MEDQAIVLVTGMHRSGTSAVTNAIEKLGFYIGREPMPATYANPAGYYEDRAIVRLNDEVLAQLNLTWWNAVVDPWVSHDAIENSLEDRARKLLLSYLDDCPKLLLKDPRFCITAPFWLPILNSIEAKYGWIFVYREPTQIMGSLAKRSGLSSSHTALLTYSYWMSALNYLRDCPRDILRFEDFAENPSNAIARVLENLGVDCGSATEGLLDAALEKDLIHLHEPGLLDPRHSHFQNLMRLYGQLVESGGSNRRLGGLIEESVTDWQKTPLLSSDLLEVVPPKRASERLPIRSNEVEQLIASHSQESEKFQTLQNSSDQEREALQAQSNALLQSWSWRVLAPIRFVLKPVFWLFSRF